MELKDKTPDVSKLVDRIVAGDQLAEAELVERYSRGVSFIIRRDVPVSSAADDLYQETFRIALEKIRRGDVREPEKLSGFICAIARNLVIEYFRRTSKQTNITDLEHANNLPQITKDPLSTLLRKETSIIVRRVLSEMPSDRDRQILFRFYIADEEKESICSDLGLTLLHFNRVIHRARERFRELFKRIAPDF